MSKLVLLIHQSAGTIGKRLERTVVERFADIELEFFNSSGNFYKRLCQPHRSLKHEIYVVLADTRERLEKLMGMKKLLDGRQLVLIMPGHEKKLLSMGHRLVPRYLSTETENFEELASVLKKMTGGQASSQRS